MQYPHDDDDGVDSTAESIAALDVSFAQYLIESGGVRPILFCAEDPLIWTVTSETCKY